MKGKKKDETGEKYSLLSRMNVRSAPALDAEKVAVLPAGTVVEVLRVEDDWLGLTDGTFILYGSGKYAERSNA